MVFSCLFSSMSSIWEACIAGGLHTPASSAQQRPYNLSTPLRTLSCTLGHIHHVPSNVSDPVMEALVEDLEALGAVDVTELQPTDWESLHVWTLLKPLQKRRLRQHAGAKEA